MTAFLLQENISVFFDTVDGKFAITMDAHHLWYVQPEYALETQSAQSLQIAERTADGFP